VAGATDPTSQREAVPNESPPGRQPERAVKRLAVGLKGAVILGQDGYAVHYRKKCCQCGFEDTCRSTMRIGQGLTRVHFFCPKCRKSRDVQIQGKLQ
jgi:hypothetical protein